MVKNRLHPGVPFLDGLLHALASLGRESVAVRVVDAVTGTSQGERESLVWPWNMAAEWAAFGVALHRRTFLAFLFAAIFFFHARIAARLRLRCAYRQTQPTMKTPQTQLSTHGRDRHSGHRRVSRGRDFLVGIMARLAFHAYAVWIRCTRS